MLPAWPGSVRKVRRDVSERRKARREQTELGKKSVEESSTGKCSEKYFSRDRKKERLEKLFRKIIDWNASWKIFLRRGEKINKEKISRKILDWNVRQQMVKGHLYPVLEYLSIFRVVLKVSIMLWNYQGCHETFGTIPKLSWMCHENVNCLKSSWKDLLFIYN